MISERSLLDISDDETCSLCFALLFPLVLTGLFMYITQVHSSNEFFCCMFSVIFVRKVKCETDCWYLKLSISEEGLVKRGFDVTRLNTYTTVLYSCDFDNVFISHHN